MSDQQDAIFQVGMRNPICLGKRLLSYPDQTRLFMCHDYPPNGRLAMFETTVAEQKKIMFI